MLRSAALTPSITLDPNWQNPALLERAWALPVASLYSPLRSQTHSSMCGPTSVANVLGSIGIASKDNPFRVSGARAMSLEHVATESAALVPSSWRVEAMRPATVAALREVLMASNALHQRVIANFAREALFGSGSGHHSPIGGYLEKEDLAFVLDVNASYGPWLVRTERLFDALNTVANWATGATRGVVRFSETR